MQLRYDEALVETAVFVCSNSRRTPPLQLRRYHSERDRLYSVLDADARNEAFFKLHLEWFREWRLDQVFSAVLADFSILRDHLAVLAIRRAASAKDEGAELYVNAQAQRTGILALIPRRLVDDPALPAFLRHELTHLQDMVDPAFGYSPELCLPGLNRAQETVARERYRLLWDISIDGRLCRAGHTDSASKERYAREFGIAYSFWPAQRQQGVFESLWKGAVHGHASMLDLIADPKGLRGANQPGPGVPCPLCGFPTFEWARPEAFRAGVLPRIASEYPDWSIELGACARCLESYEAVLKLGCQREQVPGV